MKKQGQIRTGLWCLDAKKWGWDLISDDFYMCNLGSSTIIHDGYDTQQEAERAARYYAKLLNIDIG